MSEHDFLHVITNDHLKEKLKNNENIVVIDVREKDEYDDRHIQGSLLIPISELNTRYNELNKQDEVYIICEIGGRSDLAMNFLLQKGFKKVANVLPGMSKWTD